MFAKKRFRVAIVGYVSFKDVSTGICQEIFNAAPVLFPWLLVKMLGKIRSSLCILWKGLPVCLLRWLSAKQDTTLWFLEKTRRFVYSLRYSRI